MLEFAGFDANLRTTSYTVYRDINLGLGGIHFNKVTNKYENEIEYEPECKCIALNVPIQPRSRCSLPIFHVTNKGLKYKMVQNDLQTNELLL